MPVHVRTGAWAGNTPPARMAWAGGWEGPPLAREIAGAVARADVGPLAVARAADSLLAALADSVTWASYWQEPDEWDRRLCDRAVAEALGPVAEAICRAPASGRRQDWWRATGQDADWLIPDYARLAERYDALHLTVSGYLTTAGRALPAGAGHTVLAGWDPDQTLWLTVAPDRVGPAIRWEDTGEPEPFSWTPAAEAGAGTSR